MQGGPTRHRVPGPSRDPHQVLNQAGPEADQYIFNRWRLPASSSQVN